MKKMILVFGLIFLYHSGFSQKNKVNEKEIKQKIDVYLKSVMEVNKIPGLAMAVVKNGKVIYEGYCGKASLADNTPVSKNTLFGIFSTTKIISTVGVFQLIERGKLNLEDKISTHLEGLPVHWQDVKIKNLVSHSSGLPDVVRFEDIPYTLSDKEKIIRLANKPMQFETGQHFSYNQTNYWLLTQIIEKVTGTTFEEFILKNQFNNTSTGVVFSSDATAIIPHRAKKYEYNSKKKSYESSTINNGVRAHSGNGLNINLPEFIRWNERLDKNMLLKAETRKAMWQPFPYTSKQGNFRYGWGFYPINHKPAYGFSGGNVTAYRTFPENDLSIIFLSNGYQFFDVQDNVINHVSGLVDNSLIDLYSLASEEITAEFLKNSASKAEQNYVAVKKKNPEWNFEDKLNSIAYALMRNDRLNDAIQVFELNVKENPTSANAFDSMAEGYFYKGDLEASKRHYKKSLALNPENSNASEMIVKIDKLLNEK